MADKEREVHFYGNRKKVAIEHMRMLENVLREREVCRERSADGILILKIAIHFISGGRFLATQEKQISLEL